MTTRTPARQSFVVYAAVAVWLFLLVRLPCTSAHADPLAPPTVALPHRLLALAPPLIPKRLTLGVVSPLVGTLLTATALEGATADDAALAFEWAAHESGGVKTAISPDKLDHGLMQLRGAALQGHTPDEVRQDPVLSVRLWYRWLALARTYCHSTDAAALGALSTGTCGGAPQLVRRRCALAGVDCTVRRGPPS